MNKSFIFDENYQLYEQKNIEIKSIFSKV